MHKMLMGAAAAAAFTMLAGAALAQPPAAGAAPAGPPPQAPMSVKEVKPGVYMIVGNGGNTTVRVGKDGLLLVDTKNPGDAVYAELMKNIQSISTLPVKDVFVTHIHADHQGNSIHFESVGIPVIAQQNQLNMEERYIASGPPRGLVGPTVTYTSELKVEIPGATAVAHHYAGGHTGGDTLVYFPDVKVLSAGDEVVAITPNIDFPFGGSAVGWVKSMDAVAKLDFDTVIPGHGDNPLTRAQFDAYHQKWAALVERGRAAVKAGVTKDKLLAAIKTDDLGWNITTAQWSAPARLDAFYAELSQ
jgi:cyclase